MKLEHRLHDIGDQFEALAMQARAEHFNASGMSAVGDSKAQFKLSVPELLSTFLDRGKRGFGKFTLVVPDNCRAKIFHINEQTTRWVIWQGVPTIDAGRVANLIADLVNMQPMVPWFELDNDMNGGRVRLEPWKTIEFELNY